MLRGICILIALSATHALSTALWAAEPARDALVDYATVIKPVLAQRCVACHGALKQEGRLRLDTALLAVQGGDSGPAIEPGKPESSLLFQRISATDEAERMPQEGEPLTPAQIASFRHWIEQNAPSPADEQPERDPREHWAFQSVVRPAIPATAHDAWIRNPIDAFVARHYDVQELTPQFAAPREALIRRVYLDLIGLPPTSQEWTQWTSDPDTGWYERLVEQLLADPRHGERWARHWMDIWRYSDWWGLGDQLRNSQHHIWHWRDWIIESLNGDLAYDEMLRLMLAADESHPNDLGKLRATGFLARNYFLFNRHQWMDETVEHVSKGLLGLTMNCAKCHDHKYDPIEHADYYRMRAFFEPYHVRQEMLPGQPDLARDGIPRAFDGVLDAPTYLLVRGQEAQPDKSTIITPGVPKILAFADLSIEPVALPEEAAEPARRAGVLEAYLQASRQQLATAATVHEAAKAKPTAEEPNKQSADDALRDAELTLAVARAEHESVVARVAAMRAGWMRDDALASAPATNPGAAAAATATASAARIAALRAEQQVLLAKATLALAKAESRLVQAPADQKPTVEKESATAREALEKAAAALAAAVDASSPFAPLVGAKWTPTRFNSSLADDPTIGFPSASTGRRTALAKWITDPRHPLTARVAVNHLWNRHFGTPLVATVFDFGRKESPPVQRELLDWLAAEFVESGWSMKHLHRLIMNSAVYRLSSSAAGAEENLARDPDDRYLWRRLPQRLESQVVRDSVLALAGNLDATLGGPPILPAEQAASRRRSLYFFHSNNERDRFLLAFDEASVKECYRRDQSIVPQQALALANSALVHDALSPIVSRLSQDDRSQPDGSAELDDAAFIRRAFLVLLGIQATEDEVAACQDALQTWRGLPAEPTDAGAEAKSAPRTRLIWALLNHNDFVTLR